MVDKSLKIIKLIKNAVSLILDIVGFLIFGRIPALVYQCSRLTFLFILIVF
jgi:hypothetical protein